MYECVICHFAPALDDVKLDFGQGRCVCLRCFERVVNDQRRLDPSYAQALERALRDAP